ncbi:hypothetical protein BC828DRAFT_392528 [Blastocladiella britannica]|nr:hypothetical protein BC828DRAFT_392528 [Blastocladiella britannica]
MGNALTAAFIVLGFAPLMLIITNVIGYEKYTGLQGVLRKLGMTESALWIATFLTVVIMCAASSLIALLAIPAFPLRFPLYNWDPLVVFVVMLLSGFHLVSTALIFVAALSGQYSINIFAGMLAMICIAGSAVFGILDGTSLATLRLGSSSAFEDLFKTPAKGWAWNLLPFMTVGKLVFEMQTMVASSNVTVHLNAANMTVARSFVDNKGLTSYTWTSPSPAATMVIMVVYPLIFFCLCGYINQVVGGPHPPWFPFTPSYWGLGAEPNADIHKETLEADELRVENLAVTFTPVRFGCIPTNRPIKAVKNVSLRVRKGRVLSLLGTNGAGKSTTINAITGLLRPTSGVVSCFGTGRLDKIQQMIGVTPQSDLTWPLLTAAEHVKMFAAFKDVDGDLDAYALTQLAKVGLETKGDQMVGQFSGGMRRRTAILLAGVGEPPLVVLDEPTASLDPINRRKIWAFISSLKSHAAVILTTHLLDEADALGDEVCIIDSGEVKATGTSLALKTKYGSGYEVLLLAQEGQTLESVTELVHAHAPAAVVSRRSAEMFAATIPRDQPVVPLLRFLQSNDPTRAAVIREWEVANSTLEQVFLTLAEKAKAEREAAAGIGAKPKKLTKAAAAAAQAELAPFEMPKFDGRPTLARQVMASFLKNWTYQLKQLKATVFLLVATAVILGLFVQGISLAEEEICPGGYIAVSQDAASNVDSSDVFSDRGGSSSSKGPKTCNLQPLSSALVKGMGLCAPGAPLGCYEGDWQLPTQFSSSGGSGGSSRNSPRYWVNDPSAASGALFSIATARNWTDFAQQLIPLLGVASKTGSSSSSSGTSFYLASLPSLPPNISVVSQSPAELIKANLLKMRAASVPIPKSCGFFSSASDGEARVPPKVYVTSASDPYQDLVMLLPDFGVDLQRLDASGTKLQLVVQPNRYGARDLMSVYSGASSSRCLNYRPSATSDSTIYSALQYLAKAVLPSTVYASGVGYHHDSYHELLQSIMNAQFRSSFATTSPGESIHGRIQDPPQVGTPQATPAIAVFTIPMALLLLIAAYLSIAFYEKEAKLFQYYRTNGLSVPAYWLGIYLFSLSFSLPSLAFSVILAAWKIPTIDLPQFIGVAVIHVHCTIGMGFLLAAVTSSVIMARLAAFLFAPAAAVIAGAIAVQNSRPSMVAAIFPPIQFATNVQNLILTAPVDWGLAFVSFLVGTAFIAVAILLLTLVEWQPVQALVARLTRSKDSSDGEARLVDAESTDAALDAEDEEVRAERVELDATLGHDDTDKKYAIRVVDLDKKFGKQTVLKDMYMSVKNGETYGLLGHNGCGKTTLLDILTGESRPTRGNAWVAGALTTTGRSHIASSVGVCPQNDMVVGDLTVVENLRFFARLRGAPMLGAPLELLVKRCAELIGLGNLLHRPASALSGGQRRRLQVGVAVIGSPQVILADEPSAGLDPANRLGIWKLLGRIRESGESAIVITTHSMSEADALCTRIGLVAGGRMRALGNQVALRSRYGLGNSVHLQLPVRAAVTGDQDDLATQALAAENAAMDALTANLGAALRLQNLQVKHELLDSAVVQRARGGTFDPIASTWTWEVRAQVLFPPGTDLASVFEAMTSGTVGIQDWAISQSSLEDVFIRVSNRYYKAS